MSEDVFDRMIEAGELLEWAPILKRAGVSACPTRVAQSYLELAVLVRRSVGRSGPGPTCSSSST